MERVTRADLDRIAETVSSGLEHGRRLEVQSRNGYYGLDLYGPAGMIDLLHAGTKREVYTYLQGMRRALLLTTPDPLCRSCRKPRSEHYLYGNEDLHVFEGGES